MNLEPGLHYPVEGERRHLVPVALEVDVSRLFVDAHGKVGIVHPQGSFHCRLPMRNPGLSPGLCASPQPTPPPQDSPHLQVHVSQFILLNQVIDASDLQPGLRLLLPLSKIDRNPQALLGVIQRFAG